MRNALDRYKDYPAIVRDNLANYSLDEAMHMSVGGNFRLIGAIEEGILIEYGLNAQHSVLDIGCGSGRLAARLARYPEIAYHGTDVSPEMLQYAATICNRQDFRFSCVTGSVVPSTDILFDFACFFSVFTHLLPEDMYLYLLAARKTLKPGGLVIASFLEFRLAGHMAIFLDTVARIDAGTLNQELNVYLHAEDATILAQKAGFEVISYHPGDQQFIRLPNPDELRDIADIAGLFTLGQSLVVLRKNE